jgi:chloride channel protein, CIC family
VSIVTRRRALTRGAARLWLRAVSWLEERDWDEGALLIVFAVMIGIATGLLVVGFYRVIDLAHVVFVEGIGTRLSAIPEVVFPVLTALGLWGAWAIVRRFAVPDGQNVADVQLAVAKRNGRIEARPVLWRTAATILTLASGGSVGSEGPVAVLGATAGSNVGRAFRFRPRRLKILVGCGAAAGISAAFSTPFGGAFFALEQVLGSFSVGAFSPVVVASVVGALVVRPFFGRSPAFDVPSYGESDVLTMALLFPLLGILCGGGSVLFTSIYYTLKEWFGRWKGPAWARPVFGGVLIGTIVFLSRGLLTGEGHLAIPAEVFGGLAWYLLLGLAFGKMVITAMTLHAGGSGGVFTPTLYVGAALGAGAASLGAQLLPQADIHPEQWGLIGMAGLVAGATRAPMTAIFMVFELTDDYALVPPLMIVSVIAYAVARRWSPYGLYDGWLAQRGEYLQQGADRALMDRIHARDALDTRVVTVRPGASLAEIVRAAERTHHTTIPVVEDGGALLGVIFYDELRQALLDRGQLAGVLVAADLAEATETVTPGMSLRDALRVMNARAIDLVPVVRSAAEPVLLGILSRGDVLAAYERELMHAV